MGDLLKVTEAAAVLGVHPATLRDWSDRGVVPVVRTPGNQRRYRRSDLDALLRVWGRGDGDAE
jgi:excisionase family DNA binding protein